MSERAAGTVEESIFGEQSAKKSRAVASKIAKRTKHAHREASSLETRGVTPTQQARSKATFQALIQAGMQIIESKEFQAIKIAEITRSADVSVGAFYDRFQNKEVFLAALQEIAAENLEANVRHAAQREDFASLADVDAVAALVKAWLQPIREHSGLIKATLGHVSAQPGAWSPLRRAGRRTADVFVKVLGPRLSARGRRAPEREIRIAMQFVFGIVVNSIMNNSGPLTVKMDAMGDNIVKHLSRFLELEAGGNGKRPGQGGRRG